MTRYDVIALLTYLCAIAANGIIAAFAMVNGPVWLIALAFGCLGITLAESAHGAARLYVDWQQWRGYRRQSERVRKMFEDLGQ